MSKQKQYLIYNKCMIMIYTAHVYKHVYGKAHRASLSAQRTYLSLRPRASFATASPLQAS